MQTTNVGLTSHGKYFTYVTKTIANLTTFSKKPRNYNGTIVFEIDIMKNSSPLNLKFTFFAIVKSKVILLFCWTHSFTVINGKKKIIIKKICVKVEFDKDLN